MADKQMFRTPRYKNGAQVGKQAGQMIKGQVNQGPREEHGAHANKEEFPMDHSEAGLAHLAALPEPTWIDRLNSFLQNVHLEFQARKKVRAENLSARNSSH